MAALARMSSTRVAAKPSRPNTSTAAARIAPCASRGGGGAAARRAAVTGRTPGRRGSPLGYIVYSACRLAGQLEFLQGKPEGLTSPSGLEAAVLLARP